jgi:hypothetical protein
MNKDGSVTFSEWNKGMTKHPIYGFGLLQNVEVFENPGIVKMSPKAAVTSLTAGLLPIAYVKDKYGNTYHMTGETGLGVVYKNNTVLQSGLSGAHDMIIYKDYLWVKYGTVVSAYGPLNNAPQWFGNIATGFDSNYWGKMIVGQDDILYICNGNDIASITVTASGTPGVTPTITTNLSALDLPEGQFASSIAEYGRWLMIGTIGGASYSEFPNFNTARIYPWDRVSASVNLPIIFNENGIQAMIQHANRLFVVAGTQGNVYETDSTSYRKITTLPYVENGITSPLKVFPNAIAISSKGTLLIGTSVGANYGIGGVFEVDINNSKAPSCLKYIMSTGTKTSTGGYVRIGFIYPSSYENLVFGWEDAGTFGIDSTSFYVPDTYLSVIETPLVAVGDFNNKKTFQHIEWTLSDPLQSAPITASGQSIRISYRVNNKDDYTQIGEWNYSTCGEVVSFRDSASITNAEYLQLKIELKQPIDTLYGNNINLISVRVF